MGKILAIVIILLVPLRNYAFGLVINRLSMLLALTILPLLIIFAWSKREKVCPEIGIYIVLVFWTIFSCLFIYCFENILPSIDILSVMSICIYSGIIIFYAFGSGNKHYILKYYIFFAKIFTVYIIIQAIMAYLFGVFLPNKILPFELYNMNAMFDTYSGFQISNEIRLSSIFAEPAQFAQYILPSVCFLTIGIKDIYRKNVTWAMILSFAIVLSTSANGIVGLLIIWSYYLYIEKRGSLLMIFKYLPIIIFMAIIFFYLSFLSQTSWFISESGGASKADYRIYRGFFYFLQIPNEYKICGIGLFNASYFQQMNGIATLYDHSWVTATEYFNAFAQILIYSGMIGGGIFLLLIYKLVKRLPHCGKILTICFASLCFSSSIYFEEMWTLYFVLILSSYRSKYDY